MSYPILKAYVGQLVYPAFSPRRAGKIKAVHGAIVEVKWLDGSITKEQYLYLNDFQALIDDHTKKLATHTSLLPKLNAL